MGKHILIVDDSASIRQMVEHTLKAGGYQVSTANDGQDAFSLCQKGKYDCVLTDQNMPRMDGLTLIRNLRGLPSYARIPILVLTTEAGDDMKSRGRAAGATGWLVKPFDPAKLLEVAAKVMS
jgi:two-component system chemotaxis response regulator CheY